MSFSSVLKGYEDFARKLALRAATRADELLSGGPRRIRLERSNFVLGAEAIPAPVYRGIRH